MLRRPAIPMIRAKGLNAHIFKIKII
jgi:hypothetical protein